MSFSEYNGKNITSNHVYSHCIKQFSKQSKHQTGMKASSNSYSLNGYLVESTVFFADSVVNF